MNIAISGASGKIGKEVCKYLKYFGSNIKIRLGSRTFSDEIIYLLNELQDITWQKLDIENAEELEAFIAEQDLLINTVGPASKYALKIAEIVLPVCPVIEVGYDYEFENFKYTYEHAYVYGAGMAPGFIGILSKQMLGRYKKPKSYRIWYSVREELSISAASDLVDVFLMDKVIQEGKKQEQISIPFFQDKLYCTGYRDSESVFIDELFDLTMSELYVLWENENISDMAMTYRDKPEEFLKELMRINKISTQGKTPYVKVLGEFKSDHEVKTNYMVFESQSALSGCVAALVAIAVAYNKVEAGMFKASEIKCTDEIYKRILSSSVLKTYQQYNQGIDKFYEDESGEI